MVPEAVRVLFRKTGNLQFISHLDLMRTMTSALVRARIPVYYSEGFNPHPKISFALPLSIGTQSVCEYMDMKLTEPMDGETLLKALNGVLPEELRMLEVFSPQHKCPEIGWAEYEIGLDRDVDIEVFLSEPVIIRKKTKSGEEKEVDIRRQIRRWEKSGNSLVVQLAASNREYLNPETLAKALGLCDYTILRRQVYLSDGETLFR